MKTQTTVQILKNETNSFGDQIFEVALVDFDGKKLDAFYVLNHEGNHESFVELLEKARKSFKRHQ